MSNNFDPSKLTLVNLDRDYIRNKIEQNHDIKCPTTNPIIFIDWPRSIDTLGRPNTVHHNWRDPDYWTIDVYCECQSCGASGYTSVIVDDKFFKSGSSKMQ